MKVNPGDVVFMRGYQFQEDTAASEHPALVLHTKGEKCLVAICTDIRNRNKHANCIEIDYKAANLLKPTVVICSKVGIVKNRNITRIIGSASAYDADKISNIIADGYMNGEVAVFEQLK